ncbi:Glycerol kinase [Pseudomonas aeruginosa]|nr:Glycerol kinase [Pseudomonas aeruginosa]
MFGLTRGVKADHLIRATLESIAYQTRDLLEAMRQDGTPPSALRVDGGMVVNNWVMQFLTDILGVTVERPEVTETTALGVAYMAGLKAGFYRDLDDIASHWHLQRRFAAHMAEERRGELYAGWQNAVRRVRSEA